MSTIRKALVAAAGAAVFALLGTIGGALDDGTLTSNEVGKAIGTALLAGAATGSGTYVVRNAPSKPTRR